MIVIGDAPLGRGCALACAPCSSAGPAAASAAPVRRTLRRSISLSSAVGWLTISPSIAHRSHALRSLKIEAWLWPPVKETGPRRCRRAILLAPTDGTASGHEGCKKPKGIPINESALRDVEAAAIGQQVLVFEAATGRGIDEAFESLAPRESRCAVRHWRGFLRRARARSSVRARSARRGARVDKSRSCF